jgi:hypothetical protein
VGYPEGPAATLGGGVRQLGELSQGSGGLQQQGRGGAVGTGVVGGAGYVGLQISHSRRT